MFLHCGIQGLVCWSPCCKAFFFAFFQRFVVVLLRASPPNLSPAGGHSRGRCKGLTSWFYLAVELKIFVSLVFVPRQSCPVSAASSGTQRRQARGHRSPWCGLSRCCSTSAPPSIGFTSVTPGRSPAGLVRGFSCAGFITGCRVESEERAEPCDRDPGAGQQMTVPALQCACCRDWQIGIGRYMVTG